MKNAVEIEKKYVIRLPDLAYLSTLDGFTESRIEQIYLESPHGRTHRIRSREQNGTTVYTETEKVRIDQISAFENESEIDEARFGLLKKRQRSGSRPIVKTRITFRWGEHLFEVDIYPEWTKTAIMEVELPTRTDPVTVPPFIEIVADVTGEKPYSNSSMASSFPKELI